MTYSLDASPELPIEDCTMITESGYFDTEWYSRTYPDCLSFGLDPLQHYLKIGRFLDRAPSAEFDPEFYRQQLEAKKEDTEFPLLHYLTEGKHKGYVAHPSEGRIALVAHVFHLDTIPDLVSYSKNFPEDGDQYVTHPDFFDTETIAKIQAAFPKAHLIGVRNAGQDVGAFVSLARSVDFSNYQLICKIHSKKGAKEPILWRHALLRGVLGSERQVRTIVDKFVADPAISIAGSNQLFLHGPSYLWKNASHIEAYFQKEVKEFDFLSQDWGFFAGTCFWVRTSALKLLLDTIESYQFEEGQYVDDGALAHSIERMFGMSAAISNKKVMLCDVENLERIRVHRGFPKGSSKERLPIVETLRSINFPESLNRTWKPRGAINGTGSSTVSGWLAVLGDTSPRKGTIFIDDHKLELVAADFRADLLKNNINEGKHAFRVSVPLQFCDQKEHELVLIDSETNVEISRRKVRWSRPKRDYWDFQGFLKSSMTSPEVLYPFVEEDKRAFATMELIANKLEKVALESNQETLVSVIMPAYNREGVIGGAIRSVLNQTYCNFELIVIDDGSSDETVNVVQGFNDSRIKLLKMNENVGVTKARNAGIAEAKGAIIAYLDSDNEWDQRFIAANVGAFLELPQAELVYSGTLLYKGSNTTPHGVRYGHYHKALLENRNFIDNNVIVHRVELLGKIDGFDEDLRRYVDWDLVLRASQVAEIYSIPMLLCHYYYSRTDNAITDDETYKSHLDILLEKQERRKFDELERLGQEELTRPVSVIIPSWEALDDIKDCLEAIYLSDWKGLLEIIVVDNNSTDGVKEYLHNQRKSGSIKLIELDENYGFTYAVNIGISHSNPKADIILLNNDAIAQPGAIQALQSSMVSNDHAGMIVPRQILPAGTKTLKTHVPFARESFSCDVNLSAHHKNIAELPIFHNGGDIQLNYAAFFAVYIRREVINQIGSLDAEYGRHYRSDRVYADLMRNLTHYRMYYCPNSHFIHKLQKATDQLKETGKEDKSFDTMFKKNQWEQSLGEKLGFRTAPWDVF